MTNRIHITFFALIILSGCSHMALEEIKPQMVGMHANQVMAMLGPPQSHTTIAGRSYFTWINDSSMTVNLPQTSTTNTYGTIGSTQVKATSNTTTYKNQTWHYHCEMVVTFNANLVVLNATHRGEEGACSHFARRLASLRPN